MANFNLDIIGKALPKIAFKSNTAAPVDNFLQKVLFKGTLMGTEGVDGIAFDYRKYAPQVAAEALRNADPTRLNYKSNFKSEYVVPAYYHDEDEVALEDADVRAFGEDIETNVDSAKRVTQKFAEKRDAIHDSYIMAKEKMCADAILTGAVTVKAGTQSFPMTSSLLSLSGSTLWSDFLGTISTAFNNVRKKNKSFRPNALIMNPTYANLCVQALKAAGLLNTRELDLGKVDFQGIGAEGAEIYGAVNTSAGRLLIVAYFGNDGTSDYITDQKAILCNIDMGIGAMGYGRVMGYVPGVGRKYMVEAERITPFEKGEGDMKTYAVECQSAPLPIITNLDGYGVLTSIPSTLS